MFMADIIATSLGFTDELGTEIWGETECQTEANTGFSDFISSDRGIMQGSEPLRSIRYSIGSYWEMRRLECCEGWWANQNAYVNTGEREGRALVYFCM